MIGGVPPELMCGGKFVSIYPVGEQYSAEGLAASHADAHKIRPGIDGLAFCDPSKQRCAMANRDSCPNDRSRLSAFDMIIVAMVDIGFVLPFALVMLGKASTDWLKAHIWWINVVSVGEATILVAWMFFGGKNSPLWRYFRPSNVMWVRWAAVIAIFVVSIVGAFVRP